LIRPQRLDDGRWLWEFSPVQIDLEVLQKLCKFRSPNMLVFEEVGLNQGVLTLVGQGPQPTETLPAQPKPGDLARWSLHLAELAAQLEHIGFPFRPCAEALVLKEGQVLVLDPGLEEYLGADEVASDPIQCFGLLWRRLGAESLPAHLEWISARCAPDSVIRYQNFAEIREAFHQALIVELPESGQHITKIKPLKNFQVPWVADMRRLGVRWERFGLALAMLSLLCGLIWWWWTRPLPPRNYPAAALICEGKLHLVDLNTGLVRSRPVLSSPLAQALQVRDILWLCARGERRLFRLDGRSLEVREGPVIEPDPALMVREPAGRRMYLLYPKNSRILALELPETPLFYLDTWPGCQFLAPITLSGEKRGLLVASQDKLKSLDLQTRLPQHESEWTGLSGLAVDAQNRTWVVREFGLLRLDSQLRIVEQHPLPAAPQQLISVGSRPVCALSDRLFWLEADSTARQVATEQPQMLSPDPQNLDRVWLIERKNQLVQRDFPEGRSLKRWVLPFRPSGLLLLPPP